MSLEILELVWNNIRSEAQMLVNTEHRCLNLLCKILFEHKNLSGVLSYILSCKLSNMVISFNEMYELIEESYACDPNMLLYAAKDVYAIRFRDPVVHQYCVPVLYFKGFHALQGYRISHWLWNQNRKLLALYFQSQISCVFNVDIHPAASIGSGIMFDHGTGVVIGETAVIEDDVSILQYVTLGGRGKEKNGDRHPKIRSRVMIGAGSIILGNVEIGYSAKIGAGSVVVSSVPAYATVTGNPAKIIDKLGEKK